MTSKSTEPWLHIRTIALSGEFSIILVVVMDRWPSFSRFGSRKLPRNHPHVAVFILILRVTFLRPSELLALRKKDLVPPLAPLLPCWSVLVAASETGVTTIRGRSPRWVSPYGKALASMGQKALAPAEVWKCGRADLVFRLPCSSKIVQDGNQRFGTQRHDPVPNTSQWSQHRSGPGFQNFAKSAKNEVSGRLSAVSQGTTRAVVCWKHSRTRAEVLLTEQLQVRRLTNARLDSICLTYSVDLASWQKVTNHSGLCGCVLETEFGPKCDETQPLVLTEFDKTSPLESVSQE